MGAGGVFAAPSTPHEPNVGFVRFLPPPASRHGSAGIGRQTTMLGADESLCGMLRVSTNMGGTAALCRPDMPHTLRSPPGGVEAATAPPFMASQGLVYATGTRALPPRDPGFPSFHEKRSKTRKADNLCRRTPLLFCPRFITTRTVKNQHPSFFSVSLKRRGSSVANWRMPRSSNVRIASCVNAPKGKTSNLVPSFSNASAISGIGKS